MKNIEDFKPVQLPVKFVLKNTIVHEETQKLLPSGSYLNVPAEECSKEYFTGVDEMGAVYNLHSSMGCFLLHY